MPSVECKVRHASKSWSSKQNPAKLDFLGFVCVQRSVEFPFLMVHGSCTAPGREQGPTT